MTGPIVVRFTRSMAFGDAQLGAWAQGILGLAELAAHARLLPPGARRDYLAAHALARTTLAGLLGCRPSDLGFETSPWGKPRVVTPTAGREVHFSISHADGIALCAVSLDAPIGADVESLRNVGPDPIAVACATCSPAEVDALRAVSPRNRRLSLLDIWTRKEAILKATGLGFHLPPGEAVVDWAAGGQSGRAAGSEWGIAAWRLTPSHRAAVAVRARPGDVVPFRVEEVAFSPVSRCEQKVEGFGGGCSVVGVVTKGVGH